MKTLSKILTLISLNLLLFTGLSNAAINVTPTTATTGETVTVIMTGALATPVSISFHVNFGDGSPIVSSRNYGTPGSHSFTTNYTYTQPGNYTITGTTDFNMFATPPPPLVETQNITIIDAIDDLARGIVGEDYEHNLALTSAAQRNKYQLTRGKLPPGLKLERNGMITGIPTMKGTFAFTVQVTNPQGTKFTQELTLHVDPGTLVIKVTPELINLTRGGTTNQKVTFNVIHPTVKINETIRSTRGEFLVRKRVIGYGNSPMSINLNTNQPSATETIKVPNNVLQAAQNAGTTKLTYRRSFRTINFNGAKGETRVNLRTAASGELRITKMRIFFEQNNRPIILVERNSRNLTGAVEIHYNGSGTFKGFWKVGKRIIERVQKNIFYGRVITLKTPKAPPLPTYSEGAQQLQFIITEPETARKRIDFPEAIYHVEAKKAEIVVPITLSAPENWAELSSSGETFSWTESSKIDTYLVEFFKKDGEDPFFTAYEKTGSYELSAKLISLKLEPDTTYRWRVRGFNKAQELVGESNEKSFTLGLKSAFVPGQIIFIVDNNASGRELIPQIVDKYKLQILQQTELISINRILVLCTTEGEVLDLSAKLQNEGGLYSSQPNFIFSTLNESDPLRSMQLINKIIDLDRIHEKSSGKNVLVAIIDTGVDLNHKDLNSQIKVHDNFVTGSPYQAEIHGTAVAGIIAGAHNDFGILGIAPDAELLGYRACKQLAETRSEGECYSSSIAKALDAAILAGANIVNLSLGSGSKDRLVSELIDKGCEQGIIFIAPVGNDMTANTISFPASHPKVIAVAGFGENNKPLPNRALALAADAIAPAHNIFSTTPGDKHNFLEGTSFSAATISGIIALSLETHNGTASKNFPHFDEAVQWQNQVSAFIGIQQ